MPKLSASELIKVLTEEYQFIHDDDEELEELLEGLSENALVFNYFKYDGTTCEESDVEDIYKFIRTSGWSLDQYPLGMMCWILYPTDQLERPITTLLNTPTTMCLFSRVFTT